MIYLDYNSTTPIDKRVLDEMLPFLMEEYANPASSHQFGSRISSRIITSKAQVASLINAESDEIVFTSGATESLNLALKGLTLSSNNKKRHIVTVSTEHYAVLDTCKFLETLGYEVTYLPVDSDGLIDHDLFVSHLRKDTLFACVMLVNNETGVIQDIKSLSKVCKEREIIFVTDATQAVGKITVDVVDLDVDIMAFSGHKFYAPKGIGALYVSREFRKQYQLIPLFHGGGHQNGLRSGTLNVPAIVGLGKACEIASNEMFVDAERIRDLRDRLESNIFSFCNAQINGSKEKRIYNTSNIHLPGIDANVFIGQLKELTISTGSACSSSSIEPSHVLRAMGLQYQNAHESIRVSLGKFTIASEIDSAIEEIKLKLHSLVN